MTNELVRTLYAHGGKIKKIYHLLIAAVMLWGGLQINSILKRHGIPNFHEQAQSMIMVMLLLPLFYRELRFKHSVGDAINALSVILCSGIVVTCLVTLTYIALIRVAPHHIFNNKFEILQMPGRFKFNDLKFKKHPAILFFTQAIIVAPLWEELFRGNVQKGLSLLLGENTSLVMVALAFAYIHKGSMLGTLPAFLVLGYLVKFNYSWGERAFVHSISNVLVMLNLMTFSFGGSELNGKSIIISSVIIQLTFFLFATLWLLPKFKKCIGGNHVAEKFRER